jgi:hypothetical protein
VIRPGAIPGVPSGMRSPGDTGLPEARAAGGMFMALSLILLTLVVYLFSLSLPDEARRRAVHASLAKAFYFPGTEEDLENAPKGPALLLAPGRNALRALQALLAARPAAGTLAWEGPDLVVTLPPARVLAPAGAVADPDGAVAEVSRLLARTSGGVRVEAPTVSQAVALTVALLGRGAGGKIAPARVSAVGAGRDDEIIETAMPGLRVVLVRAKAYL